MTSTRKKYEKIVEKIEQLNAEAFDLEKQMAFEEQEKNEKQRRIK